MDSSTSFPALLSGAKDSPSHRMLRKAGRRKKITQLAAETMARTKSNGTRDHSTASLGFEAKLWLTDDASATSFLRCPVPPFTGRPHPNGPIYSSGLFWKPAGLNQKNQ